MEHPAPHPHHLVAYRTASWTYILACDEAESEWRILKFSRRDRDLQAVADPAVYTKPQLTELLRCLRDGEGVGGTACQVGPSPSPMFGHPRHTPMHMAIVNRHSLLLPPPLWP